MKCSLACALALVAAAMARDIRPTPGPLSRRQLPAPVNAPAFIKSEVVPLIMNATATPAGLAVAAASSSAAPASASADNQLASVVTSAGGAPPPAEGEGAAPPPAAEPSAADGSLDGTVLAFAATLEAFEAGLYAEAQKFSAEEWKAAGFSDGQITVIQETIQTVLVDEQTHLKALSDALAAAGAPFESKCNFDLSAVTDPVTFLAIAAAVEPVGVGAYQGAAPLVSPAVLGPALQIHPVESRHAAALSLLKGETFAPVAFDMPLAAQEVLAIAGGFLKDCTPDDLGLTSNQPLVCTNKADGSGSFKAGTQLAFTSNVELPQDGFCQILVAGQAEPVILPINECAIPQDLDGLSWVFVTTDNVPLPVNDSVKRATCKNVCAGPAEVLIINEKSSFGAFFEGSLEVGSLNGAQCAYNQMKGWKDEGKVEMGGHEVFNVCNQKEVMVIDHNKGGEKHAYQLKPMKHEASPPPPPPAQYEAPPPPPAKYEMPPPSHEMAPPAHEMAPPAEQYQAPPAKYEQPPAKYEAPAASYEAAAPPAGAYYRRSRRHRSRRH